MDTALALDTAACDRARLARDARFDGVFFTAVRSTGIYCRPVCPAPPPKPRNITYFPTAAAAAAAGYRPCLRCRPVAPEAEGDPVVRRMLDALASDPARSESPVDPWAGPIEAFLVGAYCVEAELILKRRIVFPHGVAVGDVIALPNTGGYLMHILESASHQIPLAANAVRTAHG